MAEGFLFLKSFTHHHCIGPVLRPTHDVLELAVHIDESLGFRRQLALDVSSTASFKQQPHTKLIVIIAPTRACKLWLQQAAGAGCRQRCTGEAEAVF